MPPQNPVASRRPPAERAAAWALIVTLILALVAVSVSSVPAAAVKAFLLAAGAIVTLIIFIVTRLKRGNVILPPAWLLLLPWLPAAAYALSTAFSGAPPSLAFWGGALSSDTLGFMLAATVLGTLAAVALRRPEQYRAFWRAAVAALGLVLLIQVIALIVGQFAPNAVSPAFSVLGSLSDLAAFLGLGVTGILLALRFLDLRGGRRIALIVVLLVALAYLAVAGSALAWTLVALVAFALFVEAVMRRGPSASVDDFDDGAAAAEPALAERAGARSIAMPLIVLVVSLFFLLGGAIGAALAGALHVSSLNVRPSWQSTLSVVKQTYGTAPVFGTGPGTFQSQWLKYRDASLNATPFWNVDFSSGIGFIPTSFATTGIVGALAWLAFLVLFLALGARMLLLRAPEDAFARFSAILSFVATAYLFAIALLDLPGPALIALLFVCAGVFASTMRYAPGKRQWGVAFSRAPRVGFAVVFVLTLILLGAVGGAYALSERYLATAALAHASSAANAGNLDAADAQLADSLSFAPTPAAYEAQALLASARLNQIAASTSMPAAAAQQAFQTALSNGINAALTATQLTPDDYQAWLSLGNLYAAAVPLNVSGAYDSANTAYQKAQALAPTNPQIPYVIAELDIANKDLPAAETALKAAIALKQDYTDAILLLSQLEVQTGNVKDALSAAESAAYFTPNDPNILFQLGLLRAAQNDTQGAVSALSSAVAADPQFANARYFLAAAYAKQKDYQDAIAQLQAVAALSDQNAQAVASALAQLQSGKDPFPANLLSLPPAVSQGADEAAGAPAGG